MNGTKIGLGLAALGRPEYINIRENHHIDKSKEAFKENAFKVLDFAYHQGVRYFDTAPSYGKGEQYLIEWNEKNLYHDVQLGTKWGYTYVANWELGFKGAHEIKEHTLKKLLEQWQTSKILLPSLEIYQIHSATLESGVLKNDTVLHQLYQIKRKTGIKIGITTSGINQAEIIEAALNIKIENEDLFDAFQVTYNILEQSTLTILNQAKQKNKTIIIKEALANGRVMANEKFAHDQEYYDTIERISKKYKVGIDAIALRFVIDSLQPDYVLSGASNQQQLKQNLKALKFKLNKQEIQKLHAYLIPSDQYWSERKTLKWN